MKPTSLTLLALVCAAPLAAADAEPGFVTLFDGNTFDGWTPATEHANTWKIEDGAFVTRGNRCHLYYIPALLRSRRTIPRASSATKISG
jgi:hypothetical protein